MNVWPLRFRQISGGTLLLADDAGGFFRADERFLERYAQDHLTPILTFSNGTAVRSGSPTNFPSHRLHT